MIRSSTDQTFSESCDAATVHTTSSVTTKPSPAINPSQISHSKQGEVNNVVYVNNTAIYCITMYSTAQFQLDYYTRVRNAQLYTFFRLLDACMCVHLRSMAYKCS